MARAKKGRVHTIPKTLGEIKKTNLSNLTSAAQRKLLVALNREANLRLKNISTELNTKHLKPTILQENNEYFRIQKLNKGYNIGPRKRFTLAKNLPKAQMEEQIKERVKFLGSVMTVTPETEKRGQFLPERPEGKAQNIKDVHSIQDAELLDVFNQTFNKNRKKLTREQLDKLGELLNKARSSHILGGDGRKIYLKDLEQVARIRNLKEYTKSVDEILDDLEQAIDYKITNELKKAQLTQSLVDNYAKQRGLVKL